MFDECRNLLITRRQLAGLRALGQRFDLPAQSLLQPRQQGGIVADKSVLAAAVLGALANKIPGRDDDLALALRHFVLRAALRAAAGLLGL